MEQTLEEKISALIDDVQQNLDMDNEVFVCGYANSRTGKNYVAIRGATHTIQTMLALMFCDFENGEHLLADVSAALAAFKKLRSEWKVQK